MEHVCEVCRTDVSIILYGNFNMNGRRKQWLVSITKMQNNFSQAGKLNRNGTLDFIFYKKKKKKKKEEIV